MHPSIKLACALFALIVTPLAEGKVIALSEFSAWRAALPGSEFHAVEFDDGLGRFGNLVPLAADHHESGDHGHHPQVGSGRSLKRDDLLGCVKMGVPERSYAPAHGYVGSLHRDQ